MNLHLIPLEGRHTGARKMLLAAFMVAIITILWIRQSVELLEPSLSQLDVSAPLIFFDSKEIQSSEAQYKALSAGGSLSFSPDTIVFDLPKSGDLSEGAGSDGRQISLQFYGANPSTSITPADTLPGVVNLYAGQSPDRWATNLNAFGSLSYRQIYPGIDLVYGGQDGYLKGSYLVAPGADPSQIRWEYEGLSGIAVDTDSGDLLLELPGGTQVVEKAPVAWQEVGSQKQAVPVSYALARDGSISFELGEYDRRRALTIDPVIIYETIYNAGDLDYGNELAVDDDGNAYVISYEYPDFFIIKLNPNGDFEYLTLLSGSDLDVGANGVVDNMGHLYVTGRTLSSDFPVLNAIQPQKNGPSDAFVAKLNTDDGSLVFSTYLGGARGEAGYDLAYGSDGLLYLAGETDSIDFPVTPDALQGELTLTSCFCDDAYAVKLAADGSAIIYATYLGGSFTDRGQRIGLDAGNNIYLYGSTQSNDFPLQNPLQASYGGEEDTFVSKITADGSALVYSTYLGGDEVDSVGGFAVDEAGYAHVLGTTQSINYPSTPGSFQPQFHGDILGCGSPPFDPLRNCSDITVAKLEPDGSSFTFSTFIGGSDDDAGTDLALDSMGRLHIIGYTSSDDFPGNDGSGLSNYILVSLLDPTGSDLLRTLQIESPDFNAGHGLVVDAIGDFYVAGAMNVPADIYVAKYAEEEDHVADLSIQGDADPGTVLLGAQLTFSITVDNSGPSGAAGVVVTDTLPSGVDFVSASAGQGECQENAGQVLCSLGTISAARSTVITIVVRPTVTGTLTNTAEVASEFIDPVTDDNQVTMTATVLDPADDRIIFIPRLAN